MHSPRATLLALAVPCVLAASACGQVTGLSDDYEFDLVDGSASASDAASDAKADASSSDGGAGATDAAPACNAAQRTLATTSMAQLNGAQACKTCLASSCCTDVVTCTGANECKRLFTCRLECTLKSATERTTCFSDCVNGNANPPPVYTNGVGACSGASCKQDCGFN